MQQLEDPFVSSNSNQPKIPSGVQAFLIDLDGVLYVGKSPIPGVKECLQRMEELGYSYRFVSNSTRRCRGSVAERLPGLGHTVPARHIYTPSLAARVAGCSCRASFRAQKLINCPLIAYVKPGYFPSGIAMAEE